MKYSYNNRKLGDAVIFSRPVGDTCPSSCYFLNNGCYAQKTEHRWPNVRKFVIPNVAPKVQELQEMFTDAKLKGLNVRLFERGDFFLNEQFDKSFLSDIIISLKGIDRPNIWVYTHVYDAKILKLEKLGVSVYASVHNREQYRKAKSVGFTLFALNDTQERFTSENAPKFLKTYGEKFIVCPEQISNKRVTCCGSKDSLACNYCVTGKGNVLFLKH